MKKNFLPIKKICKECNEPFLTKNNSAREIKKRFCCRLCAQINNGKNNKGRKHKEHTKQQMSQRLKERWKDPTCRIKMLEYTQGKNNGFFGKTHTDESKKKMSEARQGKKLPEHRISQACKNLRRDSKSVYDIWKEKYGNKIAKQKYDAWREKLSKRNSGSGNPMFGKQPPKGSGNGWSGWYKGWFFRSLRELKYVLELEKKHIPWQSAEKHKYKIQYKDFQGIKRNYFPDFLVNGNKIVECKPKKLWNTPLIKAKTKAARKHFKKLNLIFELVDPGKFDENIFLELLLNKTITLTKKYQKKAREKYEQI